GGEPVAKSDARSKCFNNHPKLGECVLGEDDNPDKDGKCWNYCIVDYERIGVCKLMFDGTSFCKCHVSLLGNIYVIISVLNSVSGREFGGMCWLGDELRADYKFFGAGGEFWQESNTTLCLVNSLFEFELNVEYDCVMKDMKNNKQRDVKNSTIDVTWSCTRPVGRPCEPQNYVPGYVGHTNWVN
ncbi:hypothetical protein Goshw_014410, partial [Gossypium schwendimanii]|nr:hypothetical protein [Gossypium schwendimanii]